MRDIKIETVAFEPPSKTAKVYGLDQYDYGQVLRIQNLQLPAAVEIHFALQERGGDAITRIGTTRDGVTEVMIPDSMLENNGSANDYDIYAWVFLTDESAGKTEYKISMRVKSRPRPEVPGTPEEPELFRKVVAAVNEAADRAESAGQTAKSWAVGNTGTRDGEDLDNAKFYAKRASEIAAEIPGAVKVGKEEIDRYVKAKEADLKGETGNVYFAAFKVKSGRLKMYSDPNVDKVRFRRKGSRLTYRLKIN